MEADIGSGRSRSPARHDHPLRLQVFAFLLIVSFFLPYVYRGILRVDHIFAALAVAHLALALFVHKRITIPSELRAFFFLSFATMCYAAIRLLLPTDNLLLSIQYLIQYSYLFFGIAGFLFMQSTLQRGRTSVIFAVVFSAIALNLIGIYQKVFPGDDFVMSVLSLYGGKVHAVATYGMFHSKAAEILLGGGQAISIFTGMQGLATFNLFFLAIALGALMDRDQPKALRGIHVAVIPVAIVGGLLTASKIFVLGLPFLLGIWGLIHIRTFKWVLALVALLATLAAVFRGYSYQLDNILTFSSQGNLWALLESRFGAHGYLTEVMAITFEPATLLIGLGVSAADYRYADNQFRQVILVGGVPLFLIYYSALGSLAYLAWRKRAATVYAKPLFALSLTFIVSGIGMDIHFQARTIMLWVMLNLSFLTEPSSKSNIRSIPRGVARSDGVVPHF